MKLYTGPDLLKAKFPPPDLGPWKRTRTRLIHENGYDIDLATAKTPEEKFDWIMHITEKSWADSRTLAGLNRAFAEMSRD